MPLGATPPYLCLLRRNFCAAGGVLLWLQRCDFRTDENPFLLTTAAQNMHILLRKSPLHRNHFFEWLKTTVLLFDCGTSTLKSLLLLGSNAPHVHLRLRKRFSRCTLDCGFKTSESPALRGFEAERGPIRGTSLYLVLKSNGLPPSKNLPVKFGFSPRTVPANIAKKLPAQRCSKPHFIAFFSLSHKRPTFAFTGESGYTLGFRRRIAHNGSHGETGAFRMGVVSLPSARSARSQTSPGRVSERRTSPLWDLGREVLSKNAESLRDSDAHDARRCPAGVAAPLGCVIFLQVGDVAVFSLCAQYFLNVRGGGGITTLGAFHTFRKPCVARYQNGKLCRF